MHSTNSHQTVRAIEGNKSGSAMAGDPRRREAAARNNSHRFAVLAPDAGLHRLSEMASPVDAGAADWWPWVRAMAARLWASWRREVKCARDIAYLRQLGDRDLRDIGIENRCDIEHCVRSGRRRR
jgi:uncharacterized protein YjiS (DUF1127 family)